MPPSSRNPWLSACFAGPGTRFGTRGGRRWRAVSPAVAHRPPQCALRPPAAPGRHLEDHPCASAAALIRPPLGGCEIGELTAGMLRNWHAALAEAPARLRTSKNAATRNVRVIDLNDPDAVRRRRATANRVLTILKAALNLAYRDGHAQSDEAWRRVKPFREADAPKIRYLSHAETKRLVNACDPHFRPLVQCALLTGARYGEIAGFRVSDFDHDAGTITVRASKGGRRRHIVLNDDGTALFECHVAGRGPR